MPFGLKNVGEMLQRAMSYAFHDIKNIVQAYLDDLSAHSKKRDKHLSHLRSIFDKFQKYKICLNPHKCIFCVLSKVFIGFIISKYEIMVDLLKVEEIVQLPPPSTMRQLQILQEKANFL
jgi:hypothetical protein